VVLAYNGYSRGSAIVLSKSLPIVGHLVCVNHGHHGRVLGGSSDLVTHNVAINVWIVMESTFGICVV
jgi:hypothetical protein